MLFENHKRDNNTFLISKMYEFWIVRKYFTRNQCELNASLMYLCNAVPNQTINNLNYPSNYSAEINDVWISFAFINIPLNGLLVWMLGFQQQTQVNWKFLIGCILNSACILKLISLEASNNMSVLIRCIWRILIVYELF